jgi:hypothetical protein
MKSAFLGILALFLVAEGGNQIQTSAALQSWKPGWTYLNVVNEGSVAYVSVPIALLNSNSEASSIYVSVTQGYGIGGFYATTMYNGDPATLPGHRSSVCQWHGSAYGSSMTALLSPRLPGGCQNMSAWPSPVNVTIVMFYSIGEDQSPLNGAVGIFGMAAHAPYCYVPGVHGVSLFSNSLPTPIVDRQLVDTYGVSSLQPAAAGALAVLVDRSINRVSSSDSVLLTLSPQLSDGDVVVFVMTYDETGPGAEPICLDRSQWPAPDVPVCSPWSWSFSSSRGTTLDSVPACILGVEVHGAFGFLKETSRLFPASSTPPAPPSIRRRLFIHRRK